MNILKLIIILITLIGSILVITGIVLGITLSKPSNDKKLEVFKYDYPSQSQVQMNAKYLGIVNRKIPDTVKDGGLGNYPVYGTKLTFPNLSDDEIKEFKNKLIKESNSLTSTGTPKLDGDYSNYDHMDENGIFYKGNATLTDDSNNPIKLYKHTASIGMYHGNVSDDEPAISKLIKIKPRSYGNHITGLYAPPGEIIKVEISQEDLDAIGGNVPIYIGQVFFSGNANNIWADRSDFVRMPTIANKFPLDRTTIYIGSHLGGPIYIGIPNNDSVFSVTISGAVRYPHFIQGYTSEEEWKNNLNSTAPYFDLEIWDDSVRFSGSRKYAGDFSYKELYDCSILWDKISRVSNSINQYGNEKTGIVFIYEPFIAAGAAVAFQGHNSVNAPEDWLTEALNAQEFITSGSWGNIHEYNHHYQRYGLPNGGEVTNNAVSLISYSLFTIISSSRTITDDYKDNSWNRYTGPWFALKRLLSDLEKKEDGIYSLPLYATILHSFGQQSFIDSANACAGKTGIDTYYIALTNTTHYDFTYYFEDILGLELSSDVKSEAQAKNYPVFVPVASVFQVGRNYYYDDKEKFAKTVQPFEINFNETYKFNLFDSNTFAIPNNFTVTVKSITAPTNGELKKSDDKREDQYIYIPDPEKDRSGEFEVTLNIVKNDSAFEVEDIKLVLEFKAKQPTVPSRTTYYYDSPTYKVVDEVLNSDYKGYKSKKEFETSTPALWYNGEGVEQNCVTEYNAKFYVKSTNTYRLSLRGKQSILLISKDKGKTYEPIVSILNVFINFYPESIEKGYYHDLQLKKGDVIYLKVILLSSDTTHCFFEIGCSPQQSNNEFDTPSIITNTFKLYSINYEPPTFTSNYFITRKNILSKAISPTSQKLISGSNIESWDDTMKIDNIFDGLSTTFFHSKANNYISDSNPFEIIVDLGEICIVNSFLIKGRQANVNQSPKFFDIYGSEDKENWNKIYSTGNTPSNLINGYDVQVSFDFAHLRYYKLVVLSSYNQYVALNGIYPSISGTEHSPDEVTYKGKWEVINEFSSYGHVYKSTDDDSQAKFTFVGDLFMINTVPGIDQQYTVKLDDNDSVNIKIPSTFEGFPYMTIDTNSPDPKTKQHTIVIKVKKGCIISSLITK